MSRTQERLPTHAMYGRSSHLETGSSLVFLLAVGNLLSDGVNIEIVELFGFHRVVPLVGFSSFASLP